MDNIFWNMPREVKILFTAVAQCRRTTKESAITRGREGLTEPERRELCKRGHS